MNAFGTHECRGRVARAPGRVPGEVRHVGALRRRKRWRKVRRLCAAKTGSARCGAASGAHAGGRGRGGAAHHRRRAGAGAGAGGRHAAPRIVGSSSRSLVPANGTRRAGRARAGGRTTAASPETFARDRPRRAAHADRPAPPTRRPRTAGRDAAPAAPHSRGRRRRTGLLPGPELPRLDLLRVFDADPARGRRRRRGAPVPQLVALVAPLYAPTPGLRELVAVAGAVLPAHALPRSAPPATGRVESSSWVILRTSTPSSRGCDRDSIASTAWGARV